MIERAFQVAEGDVGVDAEAFHLMKNRRVRSVLRVVAVNLAGDDDADRRRLRLHGTHLDGRRVRAQEETVAQGAALLVGDDERVLGIAGGMAGREVHPLEVVEVGFNFRADADRVAERREDAGDLIERARDGVLGAGETAGAGQGDVDGLGGEGCVGWSGAGGLVEQAFDDVLERVEALAEGFFGFEKERI